MAMIRVTSSRLKAAAESLQDLNSRFKNRAEELCGKEQSLAQMWEGQAQSEAFYSLINQYIRALLEIAARYEQAEARNAEIAGTRNY